MWISSKVRDFRTQSQCYCPSVSNRWQMTMTSIFHNIGLEWVVELKKRFAIAMERNHVIWILIRIADADRPKKQSRS